MTLFAYTSHLWQEDRELCRHDDSSFLTARRRASEDVLRDLTGHGVETDLLENAFERATVELEFTAANSGELTVPAGTAVSNVDPAIARHAGVVFTTDEVLIILGGSATVTATAVDYGAPANVDAGELVHLVDEAPEHFDGVTNPAAATGGADHQMTRAATYRAMEMIYLDLMRKADDSYGAKRKVYGGLYKDEIDRAIAAGLDVTKDKDGEKDGKSHGFKRFRRS